MKTRDLIAKPPVAVPCETTVQEAAARMESANVGALLVMDAGRLAGIVTDRDIVVRAVARGYPPNARIDSFMSTEIVAVDADADVHEAYRILGAHGVRRLPVVSGDDIVGMLTVDDLIVGIATDLDRLVQPVVGELIFGHHPAPMPAVRAGVQLSSR
jgi:CBS domain-containing protein